MIIFVGILVLVIGGIIYFMIQKKNFNANLQNALARNNFSSQYKVYDMQGTNIHLVQDLSTARMGVVDESSSNFITNIYNKFSIGDCISDDGTIIAIDHTTHETCVVKRGPGNKPIIKFFSSKQIVSVEVDEATDTETKTITKTNRGSQLVGAVVGDVLLGGVGLLVGGVTASKTSTGKSKEYVSKVELKLNVEDTQDPIARITLLNTRVKKGTILHRTALEQAERWHGIFKAIMNMEK